MRLGTSDRLWRQACTPAESQEIISQFQQPVAVADTPGSRQATPAVPKEYQDLGRFGGIVVDVRVCYWIRFRPSA